MRTVPCRDVEPKIREVCTASSFWRAPNTGSPLYTLGSTCSPVAAMPHLPGRPPGSGSSCSAGPAAALQSLGGMISLCGRPGRGFCDLSPPAGQPREGFQPGWEVKGMEDFRDGLVQPPRPGHTSSSNSHRACPALCHPGRDSSLLLFLPFQDGSLAPEQFCFPGSLDDSVGHSTVWAGWV